MHLSSRSILITLLLVVSISAGAWSQMTFSDGWGKRSAPLESVQGGKSLTSYAALDVCHAAFARSAAQLQREASELYESYQRCQVEALRIGDRRN